MTDDPQIAIVDLHLGAHVSTVCAEADSGATNAPAPAPPDYGQRREQQLAAIGARPGARSSELVGEIGISPPGQVSAPLAKARSQKLIVAEGAGYRAEG